MTLFQPRHGLVPAERRIKKAKYPPKKGISSAAAAALGIPFLRFRSEEKCGSGFRRWSLLSLKT